MIGYKLPKTEILENLKELVNISNPGWEVTDNANFEAICWGLKIIGLSQLVLGIFFLFLSFKILKKCHK